tara:strand:- start:163 stop:393 length:231 start_codon:yes stop_codon:yes gene_type:complete
MRIEQGDKNNEVPVKIVFSVAKTVVIKANAHEDAHKAAYEMFMDTPFSEMLDESYLENFEIETRTDGPDGFDYIHR